MDCIAAPKESDGDMTKGVSAHILQLFAVFRHLFFLSPNASMINAVVICKKKYANVLFFHRCARRQRYISRRIFCNIH